MRARQLTFCNITASVELWADMIGVKPSLIYARMKRNDSVERCLRPQEYTVKNSVKNSYKRTLRRCRTILKHRTHKYTRWQELDTVPKGKSIGYNLSQMAVKTLIAFQFVLKHHTKLDYDSYLRTDYKFDYITPHYRLKDFTPFELSHMNL